MNVKLLRRVLATLGVAAGLGVAFVMRPVPYLVAPAATPFVRNGTERPTQRTDTDTGALLGLQIARSLEAEREAVTRPMVHASTGQVYGLFAIMSVLAMGLAGLIAQRIAALNRTQQSIVAQAYDAGLNARRLETRARLTDIAAIEAVAAQLAADTLSQPMRLREGYLVADALPAPFFSITDDTGDRYFFTTDPGLFRRTRIVRLSDPSHNVSLLSISARADILAAWEALSSLKGFTHIAVPRRSDWHLIVYRPFRERTPVWRRLRTAITTWRLTRAWARQYPERLAGPDGPIDEKGGL